MSIWYPEDHDTIWPPSTVRGEYDSDHDRIVCADCDWYDTGGPTSCAWTYHDHRVAEHIEEWDVELLEAAGVPEFPEEEP